MKSFLFALLLSLFSVGAGAQVIYNSSGRPAEDKPRRNGPAAVASEDKFTDRLIYGGGIQLGFGGGTDAAGIDRSSFIGGLSPIVGYKITERLSAGVGLGYSYYSERNRFSVLNLQTNVYERFPLRASFYYPSVWARFIVWNNFFVQAQAEYDIQRYRVWDLDRDITSPTYATPVKDVMTFTSPALFVGPGLRQYLSDRVSLVTTAMFEVLQHEYSPYNSQRFPFVNLPFDFRVGINVGF